MASDKQRKLVSEALKEFEEKVYETFDNTPWDGYNCQVGVYSYSIRTHNQHYTGQISLIR